MQVIHRLVLEQTVQTVDALERMKVPYSARHGTGWLSVQVSEIQREELMCRSLRFLADEALLAYSKSELEQAKWLVVRPAWRQYCAEDEEETFTYFCKDCRVGEGQTNDITLDREIKRMKRPFLSIYGHSTLFTSRTVQTLLEASTLTGFSFRPVNGKKEGFTQTKIVQLEVDRVLPPALRNAPEEFQQISVCPSCGIKHGVLRGGHPLKLDGAVMKDQTADIYWTYEHFGERVLSRYLVISGALYHFLRENNVANGLIVDCIVCIENNGMALSSPLVTD